MITRLAVKNFKSLRDVDLKLGLFNIFIGTNASGKSNFIDALRVLQGIGNGFTFHEILDGKPKSATSEVWEGIRGGSSLASWSGSINEPISLKTQKLIAPEEKIVLDYEVSFESERGVLINEELLFSVNNLPLKPIFRSSATPHSPNKLIQFRHLGTTKQNTRERPLLGHLLQSAQDFQIEDLDSTVDPEAYFTVVIDFFSRLISNSQKLELTVSELREYSQSKHVNRLGEHGENFAALVQTICDNPKTKEAYVSWLKELRPHEVDDVAILTGAVGEPLFAIKEGDNIFSAKVLSDGTLRFAALAAAMFQPDKPELTIIEEIENGIHPQRMRLLVELLRTQTAESQKQVVVTTHSPVLLDWLKETEYQYAFLCKRDEETGESRITPLSEIPNFFEVIKTTPPSQLFTEGWFEAAV